VRNADALVQPLGPRIVLEGGGQSVLTVDQTCGAGGCSGRLVRINLQAGRITPIAGGLTRPQALAIEPGGYSVLVTQGGTGLLSPVDFTTGAVTTVATGLGTSIGGIDLPRSVAIAPTGRIALVASRDSVLGTSPSLDIIDQSRIRACFLPL